MPGEPESGGAADSQLKQAIKGFLNKYEFLHEYRLQKLIFMADLLSVEKREERITEADFMPFMYGSYSEDIGDALEELEEEGDIRAKADMHHGKVTTAYFGEDINEDEISSEIEDIVTEVHDVTKDKSNEELANWSKETWLYNNTPYAEKMDFEEYQRRIDSGILESDIETNFPVSA